MKTKKVKVNLEIPENMEVHHIWQVVPENINVSLRQRPPKEMVFREIVGRDYINYGEFYTAAGNSFPLLWNYGRAVTNPYLGCNIETVWELVNANIK